MDFLRTSLERRIDFGLEEGNLLKNKFLLHKQKNINNHNINKLNYFMKQFFLTHKLVVWDVSHFTAGSS